MRRDIIAALRLTLRGDLSLRKSRLESFCVLVVGVLLSRTVNLSHLACMFPTQAAIGSNYRRLQRFFERFCQGSRHGLWPTRAGLAMSRLSRRGRRGCGARTVGRRRSQSDRSAPPRVTAGSAAAHVASSSMNAPGHPAEPGPVSLRRHRLRGALALALQAEPT